MLAYLSSRSGDMAGAEDALGDAFFQALNHWPSEGVPQQPEAWLLRTARNRLIDESRRRQVRVNAMPALYRVAIEAEEAISLDIFPDERLKLLFVCAHPAIDAAVRTPLMLQTVLGFDAARIASAFLVSPATMSQRLVRAKAKIRAARISFEVPERDELAARLNAVLEAIYAVYGRGWDDFSTTGSPRPALVDEAFYLARLLADLLPDEPEARGLLALMLYCESRRAARRSPDNAFVPFAEQDTTLWSQPMIGEAETQLLTAAPQLRIGRFQLEAAIQSAHTSRRITGIDNWRAVAHLHDALLDFAPTIGAFVSRAAAVAELRGAEAGLALIGEMETSFPRDILRTYQPLWVVKSHLLERVGQTAEAAVALERGIGLTDEPAVRRFLLARRARMGHEGSG